MKKILPLLIIILSSLPAHAQYAFVMPREVTGPHSLDQNSKRSYTVQEAKDARRNDVFLALVPGAVQLRRKSPDSTSFDYHSIVAYSVWGGMAISAGLAVYEQFHIVKLQNNCENDPSNANWYDEEIRKSKKVRNGSVIALGVVYIANYISALLIPDRSEKSGWLDGLGAYADPNGTIGLSYAFVF